MQLFLVVVVILFLLIATAVGIHPIHFGIMMVVNLAIGLITPPVGVCLFLSSSIANTTITKVLKAFLPFYLVMFAVLLLVSFVPQISMWLPSLMIK